MLLCIISCLSNLILVFESPALVNHYDGQFKLNLSDANKKDLIEYLKGI